MTLRAITWNHGLGLEGQNRSSCTRASTLQSAACPCSSLSLSLSVCLSVSFSNIICDNDPVIKREKLCECQVNGMSNELGQVAGQMVSKWPRQRLVVACLLAWIDDYPNAARTSFDLGPQKTEKLKTSNQNFKHGHARQEDTLYSCSTNISKLKNRFLLCWILSPDWLIDCSHL